MNTSNKHLSLTAAIFSISAIMAQAATILTPDSEFSSIGGLSSRGLDQTTDDSGLNTTAANIGDWYHDLSTGNSGLYWIGNRGTNSATYSTVELSFTFNTSVTVDTIHFWTYDRLGDSGGREIKDFDISFSTDGATFSTPISLTNWLDRDGARIDVDPGAGTNFKIGHQSRSFATQSNVTDIKFSNIVAHSVNSQYIAFSEVKFSVVPEPSTALLGGLGFLALLRRRR